MTVVLCECGHTKAAHEVFGPTNGICDFALSLRGNGCGCSEFDPAEPYDVTEAIAYVRNQTEAARVYAELLPHLIGHASMNGTAIALNAAIRTRWPKGLARVKAMAWRLQA